MTDSAASEAFARPVLLDKAHITGTFDCGVPPLNLYPQRFALQNQAGSSSRTYVLVEASQQVAAYYRLAPHAVRVEDAPERVTKGQARHPIPVILMARFAVDTRFQNKGLGRGLFFDALARAVQGAEVIGGRAFFVEAQDEQAAFYRRFDMEPSPQNPLHLFLLFKDARKRWAYK